MNTTQLKLDKYLSRDAAGPLKPILLPKPNDSKGFSSFSTSLSSRPDGTTGPDRSQWRPMTKNTYATTSMRTIQIIDPSMIPSAPVSTLKHMQSVQNLFSIGKRMPEIEIALKQLIANMETCPRADEEAIQPLSLRNVTLHGYQRHALAWMQWRETNPPFGGNNFEKLLKQK